MNHSAEVLFKLIRIALGNEKDFSLPNVVNWEEVYEMSLKQGVGAIACDGMLALKECDVDEELRYKWMGQSMVIEQKYFQHKKTIASLVSFYQQYGIPMMLLKGYGLSLNYPIPEHRQSGDIDIFLFGNKAKADVLIERDLGIRIKKSYEKHSSFIFHDVTVENHSTFFDEQSHPSNKYVNDYICRLIEGHAVKVKMGKAFLLIPDATLMGVHLLRHTACDFAANSISLRQVIDWALLVVHQGMNIEWPVVLSFVEKTGMFQFFSSLNSFCVEKIGINDSLFPLVSDDISIQNRFTTDILYGKRVTDFPSPSRKVLYGIRKTMQFWQNRWKYKIVYNDSLLKLYLSIASNRLIN